MELHAARYRDLVLRVLRDLVRIDTTNPPGNETEAALYLARLLRGAGIETRIVEAAPGRGNLIAHLRGAGEAQPLLLMGHLDVVAARPEEWRYPPFAAEVHDGFVWGRGTTDMKNMVAASAVVMLALGEAAPPLKRDLLLVATADEEHGGRLGMGYLAGEMPDLLRDTCALNEGGGASFRIDDRTYYTCQTAEKGLCRVAASVAGRAGHASHPLADIATLRLARALSGLGDGYLAGRVTQTMGRALRQIARDRSTEAERRTAALLARNRPEEALAAAGFDRQTAERHRPLFYDTAAVTALRAGDPASINVIPASATAYIDGRILPEQTREGFLALLARAVGDDVHLEPIDGQYSAGLESPPDTPLFETIAAVIAERDPGAGLVPWQCAGSTDAKHLAPLGVPVYGFVPARPLPEGIEEAGAHANDERLWIDNLTFCLEVLYDVVYRYCVESGQR